MEFVSLIFSVIPLTNYCSVITKYNTMARSDVEPVTSADTDGETDENQKCLLHIHNTVVPNECRW